MNKENTALEVARFIINYENTSKRYITNLRLQKLLYFCQAAVIIATKGKEVCFSDDMEAWDYGPVVREVYGHYKGYSFTSLPSEKTNESVNHEKTIVHTLNLAKNYSTKKLVDISHSQDPWFNAYNAVQGSVISKDSMIHYFVKENSNG